MEEVRYGIELDIDSVRLVYKAINEMLERWPGGDAVEQDNLYVLKKLLNTNRLKVTSIYNTRGGFDTTCIEGGL